MRMSAGAVGNYEVENSDLFSSILSWNIFVGQNFYLFFLSVVEVTMKISDLREKVELP